MKKKKLFVVSISSLIIIGMIGLSGVGFARPVPPDDPPTPPPPTSDKYGVFFYATDAGADYPGGHQDRKDEIRVHIAEYKFMLLCKGYDQVLIFEDIGSEDELDYAFGYINYLVDDLDSVFFYIWAHGRKHDTSDPAEKFYVKLNWKNGEGRYDMYRGDFRTRLMDLDTQKIGFLVEACHSGGFVSYMRYKGYLAMSSADEDHTAKGWPFSAEAFFSNTFWDHARYYDNAIDCFDVAAAWNSAQGPMIFNGLSSYTFF